MYDLIGCSCCNQAITRFDRWSLRCSLTPAKVSAPPHLARQPPLWRRIPDQRTAERPEAPWDGRRTRWCRGAARRVFVCCSPFKRAGNRWKRPSGKGSAMGMVLWSCRSHGLHACATPFLCNDIASPCIRYVLETTRLSIRCAFTGPGATRVPWEHKSASERGRTRAKGMRR